MPDEQQTTEVETTQAETTPAPEAEAPETDPVEAEAETESENTVQASEPPAGDPVPVETSTTPAVDHNQETFRNPETGNLEAAPAPAAQGTAIAPTECHPDATSVAAKFPAAPAPFDGSNAELPKVPGMLFAFCKAIEHHELYLAPGEDHRYPKGTRSFHDKNPGNLKYRQQAKAIAPDKDGFAMFATYEDGFDALVHQVMLAITSKSLAYRQPVWDPLLKTWRPMNFLDFFKIYDSSYGDNPTQYAVDVAAELSKIAGVTIAVDTPINNLIAA